MSQSWVSGVLRHSFNCPSNTTSIFPCPLYLVMMGWLTVKWRAVPQDVLLLITSPIVVCISIGAWSLPANTALNGCIARPVRHFRTYLQLAAEKGKFQFEKATPVFYCPAKIQCIAKCECCSGPPPPHGQELISLFQKASFFRRLHEAEKVLN